MLDPEKKQIHVLVVEDNPADARLLRETLFAEAEMQFEISLADTLARALDLLESQRADLVFLDLGLPDSKGLRTLISLLEHHPHIPIIVLSGLDDRDTALEAVRLGAQDYLVKGQVDRKWLAHLLQYAPIRKKLAKELFLTTELLHKIIQENADGLIALDEDNGILFVNPAAETIFAREAEELLGRSFGKFSSDQEPAELEIAVPGGRVKTVEYSSSRIDWEGKPALLISLRDITARKQAEQALRDSEIRHRILVENMPGATYLAGLPPDNRVRYVSPQFEAMTGISPQEYLDAPEIWQEIIHQPDRDLVIREMQRSRDAVEPFSQDYRIRVPDGRIVWLSHQTVVVRDTAGTPLFIQGFITDITAEKMLQELEAARNAAEAANRAKSDFLANMSHELRTPLNSVFGFAQLLENSRPLTEEQAEFVQYITKGGKRLVTLIDNIIALTRMEADDVHLELTQVATDELLESALIVQRNKAMKQNIALQGELEEGADIRIEADPIKLKQAIYHILDNAIKFTPSGGRVSVTIRRVRNLESEDEGQGVLLPQDSDQGEARTTEVDGVEIRIADTGKGIREEELMSLFQQFSIQESVYTKTHDGLGLGLALTKRLVELHGGRVRARSKEGQGSVFCITLPVKQQRRVK